jgi:hypothetical protein
MYNVNRSKQDARLVVRETSPGIAPGYLFALRAFSALRIYQSKSFGEVTLV